jgi:antitoxin (DNA-binding transcriptional repressor) of toxin-antitoxin stability system
MCIKGMDVPVTELRAHLSDWLDRVRAGEEVIVTDRGIPVARQLVLEESGTLLAAELWDASDAALSSRLAYPEVRLLSRGPHGRQPGRPAPRPQSPARGR